MNLTQQTMGAFERITFFTFESTHPFADLIHPFWLSTLFALSEMNEVVRLYFLAFCITTKSPMLVAPLIMQF